MTRREDGIETRGRLLKAACEVFAEKGYRRAKVADICKNAGANVASVNYYFRNKANLYREAWRYALEHFDEPALDNAVGDTPQERLQHHIQTLIQNFTAGGDLERFSRLYLMEMVNPTGLIQDAWHDLIDPRRRRLHAVIREVMGPGADDLRLRFCEMSIVNQCRMFITIKSSDLAYLLGRPLTQELIGQLAQHIAEFSLAGIQAIGEKQDGGR